MAVADDGAARRTMVGKALALLAALGGRTRGASASELADVTGLPVSTAHRLLSELVDAGWAAVDVRTHRYTVGLQVYRLARAGAQDDPTVSLVRPVLEGVAEETREAVLLAVRDGDRQLYTCTVPGPQAVHVTGEPGRHGPLHCTSQGKVLVAFAPDAERERLLATLPLDKYAPNTITDRTRLREEIEHVTSRGYATVDEEHEEGIRAISVPVLEGTVAVAALSVAAPAYRATLGDLERFLPLMRTAADDIAAFTGATGRPLPLPV